MALDSLSDMKQYWNKRMKAQGPAYVGRKGQDAFLQRQRIESVIKRKIHPEAFYDHALDFGCGMGRMIPALEVYCGHIWAVDLLNEQVQAAREQAEHVTPVLAGDHFELPWQERKIKLLWASLVFQHITSEDTLDRVTAEIERVLKPGCRVIIIDNALDRAPHVKSRHPESLARRLHLTAGYSMERITIDERLSDHWLIDGVHQ